MTQGADARAPTRLTPAGEHPSALVGLTIGPVQEQIARARSVRDLATGSRLLSAMTRAAMRAMGAMEPDVRFVFPVEPAAESLPNVLVAEADDGRVEDVANAGRSAALAAWRDTARDVRVELVKAWAIGSEFDGFDEQVRDVFDVRVAWLRSDERPGSYADRWLHLMALLAAGKALRQIEPSEPAGETRPKCSIDGVHAQMGPPRKGFDGIVDRDRSLGGVRVRRGERLSAVSLVKRFACRDLRFPDTTTVAAAAWLDEVGLEMHKKKGPWSGHWLHAPDARLRAALDGTADAGVDEDDDEPPAREAAQQILDARARLRRARDEQGRAVRLRPPSYYAVLFLDGDQLGLRLREQQAADDHRALTRQMDAFALDAADAVVRRHGTLIYAGGDDVAALAPLADALPLARELRALFGQHLDRARMSGGAAVCHRMYDLREALAAARSAEASAKAGGRDRLGLAVVKRSGERRAATLTWQAVEALEAVAAFHDPARPGGPASDRWSYRLARDAPSLPDSPAVVLADALATLGRSGRAVDGYADAVRRLHAELEAGAPPAGSARRLGFAVQTASFLTRGDDDA